MQIMVVIFGAGGTAGHIFMAMGIAYYIRDKCILITDKRGVQYLQNGSSSIFDEVHVLPVSSGKDCFSHNIFRILYQCKKIFDQNPGATYFGCGAYVSILPALVCILKGVDIHIYQGDQIVGRANKFLQHFAKVSWVSSTNLNLRNQIPVGCVARHFMKKKPMINDGNFNLLVLGSSIGSSLVESILPDAIQRLPRELLSKIKIVQQNRNPARLMDLYTKLGVRAEVYEFVDTKVEFEKSHLVIGRAGWSLISDIVAIGRPAILIPWKDAKDNHQFYNALWLSSDRRWLIEEQNLSPTLLADLIETLSNDMFAQNEGTDTIEKGILANRACEISRDFSADAGEKIARYFQTQPK